MTDPRLLTEQELEAIRRDVKNRFFHAGDELDMLRRLLDHIDALNDRALEDRDG